ncbi:hypothetical protein ACWX0O_01780 [Nitrobacteraceae bacterium UC4449_H16]
MKVNGIELSDLAGLAHEAEQIELPPQVAGRTVHIDADFLAYQTTAEKEDGSSDKTYEDMQHNAEVAVDTLRGLAAAQHVHLHLTPSTSNKGGRYDHALLKEYQGNRVDKPKPRYLGIMREWLAKRYPGTLHQFCEADDGMSSSQYAAIDRGETNLSIIASKDKDLRMVPGLHLDWDTGEINTTGDDEFGHVELVERKSASGSVTKLLKGFGHKFFWAQMLIGDTADNISGLPAIPGHVMNFIKPTAAVTKAIEIVQDETATPAKRAKAEAVIAERKDGACGPATAILILDMIENAGVAFATVKGLYKRYGESKGFIHYKTGDPVPWGKAFASEGQLLWMRKKAHDPNCVLNYWRQCAA